MSSNLTSPSIVVESESFFYIMRNMSGTNSSWFLWWFLEPGDCVNTLLGIYTTLTQGNYYERFWKRSNYRPAPMQYG